MSRSGDLVTFRVEEAPAALPDRRRPAPEASSDLPMIESLLANRLAGGGPAGRRRAEFERTNTLDAVAHLPLNETAAI